MRTLLAFVIFVGGFSLWTPDASAARKSWRGAYYAPYVAVPPRGFRGYSVCEQRARADDPSGVFGGYPCWARSAFSQGPR
jgi:hypothetical protein